VSYSTDFYTIGILAIELLIGTPPFGYFKENKEEYLLNTINYSEAKIEEILEKIDISLQFKEVIRLLTIKD
jgi:hypothetical protein